MAPQARAGLVVASDDTVAAHCSRTVNGTFECRPNVGTVGSQGAEPRYARERPLVAPARPLRGRGPAHATLRQRMDRAESAAISLARRVGIPAMRVALGLTFS